MNVMKTIRLLGALLLVGVAQLAVAGPRIEHWVSPTGARVYFVESHALPMLDVHVAFPAGSSNDPRDKAGLASLTVALLDMGVDGMDENQISSRLADLGANVSGGADADRAVVSLRTLSAADKRDAALDVFRAVLGTPKFPSDVFERERARTQSALKEALTRPDVIAGRAFWAAMYPDHPYGRYTTPESIAGIRVEDLDKFYRSHYGAAGAVVTIVGDLARSEAEAVAQRLTTGLPTGSGKPVSDVPSAPEGGEQRLSHPAAQAHILIGMPALKRGDPDFFALQVGNYTLGSGGFVSRLMREVREKRGFAYRVNSAFVPMVQPGPFMISLQTKKEQANEALKVTRDVLDHFLSEGPSDAELSAAKQNLAGSFPLALDSNSKLLDSVSVIGFYGLPLDYLDTYVANIEKVTADDVRAAFARHVKQEQLKTVVVGGE